MAAIQTFTAHLHNIEPKKTLMYRFTRTSLLSLFCFLNVINVWIKYCHILSYFTAINKLNHHHLMFQFDKNLSWLNRWWLFCEPILIFEKSSFKVVIKPCIVWNHNNRFLDIVLINPGKNEFKKTAEFSFNFNLLSIFFLLVLFWKWKL